MSSKVYYSIIIFLFAAIVAVSVITIMLWTHPKEIVEQAVNEDGEEVSDVDALIERAERIYPDVYESFVENASTSVEPYDSYTLADYIVDNKDAPSEYIDNYSIGTSYILNSILKDYDTESYSLLNVELDLDANGAYVLRQYFSIYTDSNVYYYVVCEDINKTYANVLPYLDMDDAVQSIISIIQR